MERLERHASFGGFQEVWEHESAVVGCPMRFAVYLPTDSARSTCPVIYWLSGLTCSEQNFITKSGFQRAADDLGLIVVAPDTSPRGDSIPDHEDYDLGQGAGFYIDASEEPWSKNFKMYSYLLDELMPLVEAKFPVSGLASIAGHSMGGHGALIVGLKNRERFRSISAIAPIVNPSEVPWGRKAFHAYLGDDETEWARWDACQLAMKMGDSPPIRIAQGLADDFYPEQLQPEVLMQIAAAQGLSVELDRYEHHDHSYYFIASVIEKHLAWHAEHLNRQGNTQ